MFFGFYHFSFPLKQKFFYFYLRQPIEKRERTEKIMFEGEITHEGCIRFDFQKCFWESRKNFGLKGFFKMLVVFSKVYFKNIFLKKTLK